MADIEDLTKRVERLEKDMQELQRSDRTGTSATERLIDQYRRHSEALNSIRMSIADMRHEFSGELNTKLTRLEAKVDSVAVVLSARMTALENRMAELPKAVAVEIGSLATTVDRIDVKVETLASKVDTIGERVGTLTDKVDTLAADVSQIKELLQK